MRIINGSSFSIPTTVSKSRNNGNLFQALNKNVDPLKTNDGHTDPVGAAKQRLGTSNGKTVRRESVGEPMFKQATTKGL